jgi:hypothetical protein
LRPMTQQPTGQNNLTISTMAGCSVPIVSQTAIYSDEMALPPCSLAHDGSDRAAARAGAAGAGRPRLGPQQLGRVAAAESIRVMPMIMAFITASFRQHASLTRSSRNTRSSLPAVNSCPKWSQAGTLMRSRCHQHGHQGPHLRGRHHARRGSTGLMPCRYIIPFVQGGGKR